MLFHQLKPHILKITSSITKAFRGAHMKYKLHLQEIKKKQSFSDTDKTNVASFR